MENTYTVQDVDLQMVFDRIKQREEYIKEGIERVAKSSGSEAQLTRQLTLNYDEGVRAGMLMTLNMLGLRFHGDVA